MSGEQLRNHIESVMQKDILSLGWLVYTGKHKTLYYPLIW